MNLKSRMFLKKFGGAIVMATGVPAAMHALGAQQVLMGPPATTAAVPPAVQEDSTNNEMSVFMPSFSNQGNGAAEPLTFGPVVIRPHPYYHFMYATGLQNGPGTSEHSIIQDLAPGVAVDLGRHWTVDYTPTIEFYSNRNFHNTVDHSATLSGGTRYEDWVFSLSQSFMQSDSTLVETATQTKTQSYNTEFSAKYQLNDKFYEETDLSQSFNFVSGIQDSRQWSGTQWLHYVFNRHLNVGISAGGGYDAVESDGGGPNNPDQAFEQVNGQVQWRATDKLSLSLIGGFEERQLLASGTKAEQNPTFTASIEYAPFQQTQIALSASRSVAPSDFVADAQSTTSTSVSVQLTQRLLEKYFLTLGVSYDQNDYDQGPGTTGSVRSDDTYNFNARIGRTFLKRGNVALTYQYSENQSDQAGFSYNSNQIGFEVGFTY